MMSLQSSIGRELRCVKVMAVENNQVSAQTDRFSGTLGHVSRVVQVHLRNLVASCTKPEL